jgi:hypothetical protein
MACLNRGWIGKSQQMSHRIGHRIFLLLAANCVQIFVRFRSWITARPRLVRFIAPAILLAVLFAPSIWMLSAIPPLWKDVDAYLQLTRPPGSETILQYGPLYCFIARIPLYVGYATDCLRAGVSAPGLSYFDHPLLTDSGVFLLVGSQHLALALTSFYVIAVTTRLLWVRFIIAVIWAANPLFYTLAHCVGGETLSMILVLLIGATGLRIIRHSQNVPKKEWFLVGTLLWLCALTRQINAVLAGLLPLTLVLLVLYRSSAVRFVRCQSCAGWNGPRRKQSFQKAIVAVAVGISSIVLANASLGTLCYVVKIPYHSVVGFAFLGRLKFLATLPVEERNQLLDKASKNASSADVKGLISLLRNEFNGRAATWDAGAFRNRARASLVASEGDLAQQQRFYHALNGMVAAFLWPPSKLLLSAVATDFKRSQQITIPEVVAFLFVTTRFYFSHRDVMPQCASLITFRDKNADQIFGIFKNHSYFRHPKNVSYHAFLLVWIVLLAALFLIAKIRKRDIAGVASYATALIVIAILMMLANCLLAIFQPRYTLPMWELTLVSLSILFGGMMDALLHQSRPLHPPELNDQAKHPDHVQGS